MARESETEVLTLRLGLDDVRRPPRPAKRNLLITQHGFDVGGLELLAVGASRRILLQSDDGGIALGQLLRGGVLG
jgi:hypothetical protein